jgi:hypothetical protein
MPPRYHDGSLPQTKFKLWLSPIHVELFNGYELCMVQIKSIQIEQFGRSYEKLINHESHQNCKTRPWGKSLGKFIGLG